MNNIHLGPIDYTILSLYFVFVIGIGAALKPYMKGGAAFLTSGRSIPAWVTGLAFLSANLGAQEVIGMAASGAKYGIMTSHFYWVGAIPAMVFLAIFMMPFYYGSKARSVPEYLKLRFDEKTRGFNAISFAVMTVFSSGISLHALAKLLEILVHWPYWWCIWISAGIVLVYIFLGGLTSAIYNEVLQFFMIVLGFTPLVFLGLKDVGGWSVLKEKLVPVAVSEHFAPGTWTQSWIHMGSPMENPMGIGWFGMVMGLGFVLSFGYWCTDFLVVQRAMAAKDLRSAQMAPIIASYFKMLVPLIVILPGLLGLAVLPYHLVPESAMGPGLHSYNEVLPLMLARYCTPGLLGLGITALIAGFMSGMAGNVSAFATVWTYDIYQPYIKKGMSDAHYVKVGRWCTLGGVFLSIITAYFVQDFKSIMDYMQALVGFFISPLFGTVVIGMVWKRATAKGGFWGLLAGTGSSVAMYTAVKLHPAWIRFVAISPDAKDMAENVYRALWSLLICVVVTVIVSLFTKPKTDKELSGLTWGATMFPRNEHLPFYKTPLFWAGGVAIFFAILQWMFW